MWKYSILKSPYSKTNYLSLTTGQKYAKIWFFIGMQVHGKRDRVNKYGIYIYIYELYSTIYI